MPVRAQIGSRPREPHSQRSCVLRCWLDGDPARPVLLEEGQHVVSVCMADREQTAPSRAVTEPGAENPGRYREVDLRQLDWCGCLDERSATAALGRRTFRNQARELIRVDDTLGVLIPRGDVDRPEVDVVADHTAAVREEDLVAGTVVDLGLHDNVAGRAISSEQLITHLDGAHGSPTAGRGEWGIECESLVIDYANIAGR